MRRVVFGWPMTLFLAVCAAFLVLAPDVIGRIEGRFLPVVSEVRLSNPSANPPPIFRHVWNAEAAKFRDCNFDRIEWFLGDIDGRAVRVDTEFLDPPKFRDTGDIFWSGLAISLDVEAVRQTSFSYVYHDCGFPWLVRSTFFNSRS